MEQNNLVEFVKRHKIIIILVSFLLILLFVLSRFSFITITIKNPNPNAETTYYITDSSGKSTTEKSNKPSYRKLVGRGKYTVTATQDNKNFFAFISTSGFLLNKKVSADLQSEKSRTFVGDNPNVCMQYTGSVLLSYACNSTLKTLKAHLPATATQATFARALDASGNSLEGIVRVNGQAISLIKPVGGDRSTSPRIMAVVDQNKVDSVNGAYHSELSSSRPYELQPYRDGFVVLGEGSSAELYYYTNPKQTGEKITIGLPKDDKLTRYAWGTSKDSVAVAYTDRSKRDVEDVHDGVSKGSTTVMLLQDNKPKEVKLAGYFTSIMPCGTKKLCVLNNKQLEVYDIAGKPKLLYKLANVQAINNTKDAFIVATTKDVLALNIDQQTGFVDYTLGGYTFCGMSSDQEGYQLCMISEEQRKVALRFDRSKEDTNSIDKKIAELQKFSAVSVASVYGNHISVIPNYGGPVYNPASKIYEADPATIKRVNTEFTNDLQRIGINMSEYTISGLRQ